MFQVPMDVFAYTREAAAVARGGRLVYANGAARELLGADCEGKSLSALLGADVAEFQASDFVADIVLRGRHYSLRSTKQESGRFLFITAPEPQPAVLNEALLYALRSNMMTMNLALELCRSKAEEQENEEILRTMRELSRGHFRMSRLTSNLSLLRDALSGSVNMNIKPVDIGALCRDCADCVASLKEDVDMNARVREGLYIMADVSLIKVLVANLISNCLVHGHGLSRINVNVQESPDSVIISVSDDGCGIPGERLHQVFERYRHVYEMSEMNLGAGIGLSVARYIAALHGGTVLLESRENSGTTVRASLKRGKTLPVGFRSSEEDRFTMAEALVQFSDCLDSKYYGEKYLD